jgi:mRNA-degrading endonuclease RelE of RelBE toxin-antitoxin system
VTWTVVWHPAVENDLRGMPWREAARAAAAVFRFAEIGEGEIQRLREGPGMYQLRASRSLVVFHIDKSTQTLVVWSARMIAAG